ncbi:acetoin utilization deacetylase AcuC-like enzyme [Methylopila capsulata]|uniref:Acetoin utilization deacetylase AcuC-like enzyme n=1 Tax=Methylopila capsulata TaxID=61654 RepID=A0A9W6IWM7_9HYPH|nr:histone deacetylase family protein [Methylopila capsulata]MBM7852258.1 acetoin utilization deacetylase AcuC-like enzyme [Methylopila capsulata]GLK56466.1 acetoin utilization protein [Methylopila capsulata]
MSTLYVSHPAFADHLTPPGHPERPERMRAVEQALEAETFQALARVEAPLAEAAVATLAHPEAFVEALDRVRPREGSVRIDGDTVMSVGTWEALLRGLGGVTHAVDEVMAGRAQNAFCGIRPPGHHAEQTTAMGFCFFNFVVCAARHAQKAYGAQKVAIVDFDVHHGNGTQAIVWDDPSIMYASTHQMPLFPGTGARSETGVGNIVNCPMRAGDGGDRFREAFDDAILPSLKTFSPDLIVISAGFDAHKRDPLGGLWLVEDDYSWMTKRLMDVADEHAGGRVVSVLEGGYDLQGLGQSTAAHVRALMRG